MILKEIFNIFSLRVVGAFLSLVLVALIVKVYSVSDVANYFVFLTVARFLQCFNLLSLSTDVTKRVGACFGRGNKIRSNSLILSEALSFFVVLSLILVLCLSLINTLMFYLDWSFYDTILLAGVYSFFSSLNTLLSGFYLGNREYNKSVSFLIVIPSIVSCCLIGLDILILDSQFGPINLVTFSIIFVSLISILNVSQFLVFRTIKGYFLSRFLHPNKKVKNKLISLTSLSYGEFASQLTLLVIINSLKQNGTDYDVAIYGLILRFSGVIGMFSFSISQYFSPKLSNLYQEISVDQFKSKVISIATKLAFIFCAFFLILLPIIFLIKHHINTNLTGHTLFLLILILGLQSFSGVFGIFRLGLVMSGKYRQVGMIAIFCNITVLFLCLFATNFIDAVGALAVAIISYGLILLLQSVSYFYSFVFRFEYYTNKNVYRSF